MPTTDIWTKVNSLADESQDTDLTVSPTLFGERHEPSLRGSITNITSTNTSLGSVYLALNRGIISNLHSMMSREFLLANGITRIAASGTAVGKNAVLAREIERQYRLPVVVSDSKQVDAAVGAALAMIDDVMSEK